MTSVRVRSHLLVVLALTALGAALRFATLDRQSFWLDELVTASLLDRGFVDALREVPRSEATPFVYYIVAWAWGSLFGLGEAGLRSLSALAGTATIPVAYGAGAVLVSRRSGLVAAALVAVNPFLIWYSQEARSYALLALFGAASVLAFGFALRGAGRWVVAWAAVSVPAIATRRADPGREARARGASLPEEEMLGRCAIEGGRERAAKLPRRRRRTPRSSALRSSGVSRAFRRTSSSATGFRPKRSAAGWARFCFSSGSRFSSAFPRASVAAPSSLAR